MIGQKRSKNCKYFISFEFYADDISQWLQNSKLMKNKNCYVLNFGWQNDEVTRFPQIMMTLDKTVNFKKMWTESPGNCFIVLVGSKYFQDVDQIENKVEEIQNQVSHNKIEKMFYFEKSGKNLPTSKTFKRPKV